MHALSKGCKVWGVACAAHVLSVLLPRAEALHVNPSNNGEAQKKNPYEFHYGACSCDLRELECLPSVECLQAVMAASNELIAGGVEMRWKLKQKYHSEAGVDARQTFGGESNGAYPLGKVVTYVAILNWMKWIEGAEMGYAFSDRVYEKFIDENRYPECQKQNLTGAKCFWNDFTSDEDLDELEERAIKWETTESHLRANLNPTFDLEQFRKNVFGSVGSGVVRQDDVVGSMSADEYLLSMAHIARIQFNRRKHLQDLYKNRASVINPGAGALRVGLHIRRADSCSDLNKNGYMQEASSIDTHAQMTNVRLCYHTNVYVKILRRIQRLYGKPLAVYLSSDDSGSILDEINGLDPEMYASSSWHYLNFSRGQFKYVGQVEGQDDETSGFLGETAALDTWHLSHSQFFVGSFGSRFAKAAYLLAVARHNIPVPYVSVDGHNYCCQNDEQCSNATRALTGIVDCLTFAPQLFGWSPNGRDKYWEEGVTVRWDRPVDTRRVPWNTWTRVFGM